MPADAQKGTPERLQMLIQPTALNVPTLSRVAGKVVEVIAVTAESITYGRTEPQLAGRKYCSPLGDFEAHSMPAKIGSPN